MFRRIALFAGLLGAGFFVGRVSLLLPLPDAVGAKESAREGNGAASRRPSSGAISMADPAAEREGFRRGRELPPSAARDEALVVVFAEWAKVEPSAALAAASAEALPGRGAFIEAALTGWAERDPSAAWNWARGQGAAGGDVLQVAVIAAVARSNPELAVRWAEALALEEPARGAEAGTAVIDTLLRSGDYRQAREIADSFAGEAARAALVRHVVTNWSLYEPGAAAQWVLEQRRADEADLLRDVGQRWADVDAVGALRFGIGLPADHPARANVIEVAAHSWVARNAAGASAWADQFEPGPDVDAVAAAIAAVPELVARKPDVALGWAESIVDPHRRDTLVGEIMARWAQTEPAAARAYLQRTTALSAAARARLDAVMGAGETP